MTKRHVPQAILSYLADYTGEGLIGLAGAEDIAAHIGVSRPTVNRYLASMVAGGDIIREGAGPATAYRVSPSHYGTNVAVRQLETAWGATAPPWSAKAQALRAQLEAPMGTRRPVSYQRDFVDNYRPNQSSLLPPELANSLLAKGRAPGQQPAGTYARKVLEPLLIDLSWHSSRLEGNPKSLLDTRELFARGRSSSDDFDASMLLNHKDAIEFMIDSVPEYGITVPVVRNLHSLLMQGLLENIDAVGGFRKTVVYIAGSVYLPTQVPSLLEEMLGQIVEKAKRINNPIEAAFFLWVNLAYLQSFEDGNKRTSRLCANLPLLLMNCAPLSFLDVESTDYAMAMLGVYERLDVTLAVELFEWTYRRSISKYAAVLASVGLPDPLRARFREHLGEAIRDVVASGVQVAEAAAKLGLAESDLPSFQKLLLEELQHLAPFNCARYRLSIGRTEEWIRDGRQM